jgi:anti-sigma-K factor RskA
VHDLIDVAQECEETQIVTTDIDDEETIRQVVDRLEKKFPALPRAQIEDVARAEFMALSDRPVRDFLTILTERAAKKRLRKTDAA